MRVAPPNPAMQSSDESGVLHHGWVRWLQGIFESLGWDQKVPMYADLPMSFVSYPATAAHSGDLSLPAHAAGSATASSLVGKLPNNYRKGSNLEPYVDWMPVDANSGSVLLELGYAVAGSGSALGTETEESLGAIACPEVAKKITRTLFTAIDGSDFAKGDSVAVAFKRAGNLAGDDYGSSILIAQYGVRIQVEGIGWETVHP